MSTFLEPYRLFYKHRELLRDAVAQSLRERHAGSVLGVIWLLLGPLLLLGLYALLYSVIFKIRPIGLTVADYILYIFSGLIPFIAFSQALAGGTAALSANKALLLNRMFPAELIPAREVLSAGAFLLVGGGVIIIYKTAIGEPALSWLLLPVVVTLLAMATMGLVWALSLANLVMKDVQQMLTYIIIMLLIASPIAYTPEMVPPTMRVLLYLNPFAYFVMSFQSLLVLGKMPPLEILAGCVVFALASFHIMYRAFSSGKRIIADQI